jgi:replicative DNA helicase
VSLPHDLEAERAVVGGCLLRPELVAVATSIVDPDDLHDVGLRGVLEVLADHDAAGQPWDLTTVATALRTRQQLDMVGGLEGLSRLCDHGVHGSLVERHARRVRSYAEARRLAVVAGEIWDKGRKPVGDPDAFVDEAAATLGGAVRRKRGAARHVAEDAEQIATDLLEGRTEPAIPTRFADLDSFTGGLREAEVTILAARPGVGKTALALDVAAEVSRGLPVLVFSLEMRRSELIRRLLCNLARVDSSKLRHAHGLTREEQGRLRYQAGKLRDTHLHIDDDSDLPIAEIRARARGWRHAKRRDGLALVVVDYLQLAHGDGDSREQQVASISRGFKAMSKELALPVLVLSQINRAVESRPGGKPQLSDLRESGSIEQDADHVWLMWQAKRKLGDREVPVTSLRVAKNRHGPTGTLDLHYEGRYFRFEGTSNRDQQEIPR